MLKSYLKQDKLDFNVKFPLLRLLLLSDLKSNILILLSLIRTPYGNLYPRLLII